MINGEERMGDLSCRRDNLYAILVLTRSKKWKEVDEYRSTKHITCLENVNGKGLMERQESPAIISFNKS